MLRLRPGEQRYSIRWNWLQACQTRALLTIFPLWAAAGLKFAGMISDGWSNEMVYRFEMLYDTDIGAWVRRRSLLHQWIAGKICPARPLDMPSFCHADEVVYNFRL